MKEYDLSVKRCTCCVFERVGAIYQRQFTGQSFPVFKIYEILHGRIQRGQTDRQTSESTNVSEFLRICDPPRV